jgi:ankyrin repeat protein
MSQTLWPDDPLAVAATEAVRSGDVEELTVAFWCACHGGQPATAAYLLDRGADLNWISVWDGLTPLDAATRKGADELVTWLRARGAMTADELDSGPHKENDR